MGVDTSQVDHLAADLAAAPAKVTAKSSREVSKAARKLQRDARRFAPVLTGALREGIVVEGLGLSSTVTSTADYGGYQEYGTSVMAPNPYMRPAADLAGGPLEHDLADVAENIL